MAKNGDFLTALQNIAAKPEAGRNEALDSLISANSADPVAFRKAIYDHTAFWSMDHLMDVPGGQTDNAYFTSDNFLDAAPTFNPNFQTLQQLATEQRVKLGLKNADENVLVDILTNNRDECRAYLATKSQFGSLSQAHGWIPTPPVAAPAAPAPGVAPAPVAKPQNTSSTVLTDRAITAIQNQAASLLLVKLIEKSTDPDLRTKLIQLSTAATTNTLRAAAITLDFPRSPSLASLSLAHPLSNEVRTAINARLPVLQKEHDKTQFQAHVSGLSPADISVQKDFLELEGDAFKNELARWSRINVANITQEDVSWAKGLLGARYIHHVLSTEPTNKFDPALNTADLATFQRTLKQNALLGNYTYIDHAVTQDNQPTLKKILLNNKISGFTLDNLKSIINTANLDKFKESLVRVGITSVDWVQNSDLAELKQLMRNRQFALVLNPLSKLGSDAHPDLLSFFAKLPVAKQNQLLTKPATLRSVLQATDQITVEHYLGKNALFEALVIENERLSALNRIHNAVVAKVLATLKPPVLLNDAQVEIINTVLGNLHADDFTNLDVYKGKIQSIKAQCGPTGADVGFNQAFCLNPRGTAFTTTTVTRDEIKAQFEHNLALSNAYDTSPLSKKKLLDVFLSLNKTVTINATDVNTLVTKFTAAKTAKEYITSLTAEAPFTTLKSELDNELSNTVFDDIKNQTRHEQFKVNNAGTVLNVGKEISTKLGELRDIRKPITENAGKFKFIAEINPVHLINPAFQIKAREEAVAMKAKYQSLSDNCTIIVDQLRRNQVAIENYVNSIPEDAAILQHKDEVKLLRNNLNKELEVVKSDLELYKKVQENLSGDDGILQTIDAAAKGGKNYLYKAEGITRTVSSRATLPALQSAPIAANPLQVQLVGGGDTLNLLLEEKIPEGQVAAFDIALEVQGKSGATVQTIGRFTQEYPKSNAPVTSKNSKNTSVPSGVLTLDQFPKALGPKTAIDDEKLKAAKVNFAMTMAVQALASLDAPPTKDKPLKLRGSNKEELNYIYTALIILGENNPHMKFGRDAVVVNSAVFEPEKDRGFLGYTKDSLYKSVFKQGDHQKILKEKIADLKKVSEEKFDHKSEQKKGAAEVDKGIGLFKSELKDVREKAKNTIEKEGPAVVRPPRRR